jgi:spermidine/putrescine ABC transporter ATP-binding subunit
MDGTISVEIERVTKRFGDFVAVDDVSLEIRRGEFFSLLGPSGCGKTTLLRMIGGFELPSAGTVRIDGQDMTMVPPNRRPVNMVFQSYALFPHLTAVENVGFGLRYKALTRAEAERQARTAMGQVRLVGLEDRYPHQLSGGQRQRVALARAIVLEPKVLLLDEPLSALDQKLRQEMQVELKDLQRELGITFLFVTHDQEEALTMSDRIAIMNQGRVEQMGESSQIFEYPKTEFVAQFMGAANFFTGVVNGLADGLLEVGHFGRRVKLKAPSQREYRVNEEVRLTIRPEKLELRAHKHPPPGEICTEVTIENRVYQGVNTVWIVRNEPGDRFYIYDQNEEPYAENGAFRIGGKAWMCWNPQHTIIMEKGDR